MGSERQLILAKFIFDKFEEIYPVPGEHLLRKELAWLEVMSKAVSLELVAPSVFELKHINFIRDNLLVVWKAESLVSNLQ